MQLLIWYLIKISDILTSDISNYQFSELYDKNNLILIENSKQDILNLTLDMFDSFETNTDDFQICKNQISINIHKLLKPHHYSFGSRATISFRYICNSVNKNSPLADGLYASFDY